MTRNVRPDLQAGQRSACRWASFGFAAISFRSYFVQGSDILPWCSFSKKTLHLSSIRELRWKLDRRCDSMFRELRRWHEEPNVPHPDAGCIWGNGLRCSRLGYTECSMQRGSVWYVCVFVSRDISTLNHIKEELRRECRCAAAEKICIDNGCAFAQRKPITFQEVHERLVFAQMTNETSCTDAEFTFLAGCETAYTLFDCQQPIL